MLTRFGGQNLRHAPLKPPMFNGVDRSQPLARGLSAYWPCTEGGSGPRDLISGYRAMPIAPIQQNWQPGKGGPSLWSSTAGSTGWSAVTPYLIGYSDLNTVTIACRILISSLSANNVVFSHGVVGSIAMRLQTTGSITVIANGVVTIAATATALLSLNTWYDIVYTRSGLGATSAIYIDGISKVLATNSTSAFTDPAIANHTIGALNNTGSTALMGNIEYVALWNRALNATEAMQLHSDPYIMLAQGGKWFSAVSGVSFRPAWGFGANQMLSGGYAS